MHPSCSSDVKFPYSIDGAFLPWAQSLRSHLLREYPLPEGLSPIPLDVQLPPKFTIELAGNMDAADQPMPDRDEQLVENSDDTGLNPTRNAASQEPMLDRTAALFSHADTPNPEFLDKTLQAERLSINSIAYNARLSENTANQYPGGIDILDRPNVLRDHPNKYSIDDSTSVKEVLPPPDILPIENSWTAVLRENRRITPSTHWQDVRHLVFDVLARQSPYREDEVDVFCYVPGDAMVIYPKNFPQDVQTLIDLMGWQEVADMPFEHHALQQGKLYSQPKNCFPLARSTLRQLLLHNYDITAIPKRLFFEDIAFYTDDPIHKERLQEFANPALSDEFYDYTSRPRRSILEVLQDFPSVKIPYQHVPSIFPVIRGREYSAASGGRLIKSDEPEAVRVELLVALVKYKTVLRKTRQGLCSRYLASLAPGTIINVGHKEYNSPNAGFSVRPLLAIGPGTGIAPIRAHLWDRRQDVRSGDAVLFFGGRNQDADFYFRDEWDRLGVKVFTAFSRDQKEKIYVQDRIREQAMLVCEYLQNGACVYICGSSGKMPEAVRTALYDAMVIGKLAPDRETAKRFLHATTPIWEEVW